MIPQSQLKWEKENTLVISAKLHRKYDADIIEYITKQKSRAETIKNALRLLIKTESEAENK